jgi:hypothetical protein
LKNLDFVPKKISDNPSEPEDIHRLKRFLAHRAPAMKPRWYQYSLRSLMLLVLLVAICMSWFAVKLKQAREQRAIADDIIKNSGEVFYDYQYDLDCFYGNKSGEPAGPLWLRHWFGDDLFNNLAGVNISDRPIYDRQLQRLANLHHLKSIILWHADDITDAGIEHLKSLTNLECLWLCNSKVTDAGLKFLEGSTKLKRLTFCNQLKITDVGLQYIRHLKELKYLELSNMNITDSGLEAINNLNELEELHIAAAANSPQITDSGLRHLKSLRRLYYLSLFQLDITGAGLAELKTLPGLERLEVSSIDINDTDLGQLKDMGQLKELKLKKTKVTGDGINGLQKSLPQLMIEADLPK